MMVNLQEIRDSHLQQHSFLINVKDQKPQFIAFLA